MKETVTIIKYRINNHIFNYLEKNYGVELVEKDDDRESILYSVTIDKEKNIDFLVVSDDIGEWINGNMYILTSSIEEKEKNDIIEELMSKFDNVRKETREVYI